MLFMLNNCDVFQVSWFFSSAVCLYSASVLQWDFSTNFQVLYFLDLKIDLFSFLCSFHFSADNFYRFIYCKYSFSYLMEHSFNIWFEISLTVSTSDMSCDGYLLINFPLKIGHIFLVLFMVGMCIVPWILWIFFFF